MYTRSKPDGNLIATNPQPCGPIWKQCKIRVQNNTVRDRHLVQIVSMMLCTRKRKMPSLVNALNQTCSSCHLTWCQNKHQHQGHQSLCFQHLACWLQAGLSSQLHRYLCHSFYCSAASGSEDQTKRLNLYIPTTACEYSFYLQKHVCESVVLARGKLFGKGGAVGRLKLLLATLSSWQTSPLVLAKVLVQLAAVLCRYSWSTLMHHRCTPWHVNMQTLKGVLQFSLLKLPWLGVCTGHILSQAEQQLATYTCSQSTDL